MSGIPDNLGVGGSHLSPNGSSGKPSLKQILDALNAVPDWESGIAVGGHTATLAQAGPVLAAEGTTGAAVGGKLLVQNGAPAVGEVDVNYDADGVPTLLFNAADNITVAAVYQLTRGDDLV